MRTDTQTVMIAAPAEKVINFLADPENLPRWAIGFAQDIRRGDGGDWIVTTPHGELTVRIKADQDRGIVDYLMNPAPGVESTAYSRVMPNEQGAELVFTQFQAPGMPDEVAEGQIEALTHEFNVLKSLLEVQCPTG